jgi:glycosyltransferase involved in cell wall biosynthesis
MFSFGGGSFFNILFTDSITMHIAIDGRTIKRNRTGVGVYAERLVKALLQLDQKNAYTVFLLEDDPMIASPNLQKVMIRRYAGIGPNRVWENLVLPRYLTKNDVDIYFCPAYVLPILRRRRRNSKSRTKFVVTIHDLVGFIFPETFTLKMRLWQHLFVGNAVRVADRILADSEATKKDILRFYNLDANLINVVYPPVGEQFRPITDPATIASIRKTHNLPEKFILYVGTLEPRKNVAALARAYAKLPGELRDRYALILAGAAGWYSAEILKEIDSLKMTDRIRILGYVDRGDLAGLYSMATVFAYLSVYEGFGSPPLEAMACGTPVLSSHSSSLPEAVGDAGFLVDPNNIDEISAHLARMLTDDSLRKKFSQAGLKWAQQFSALEKAREVLRIFEEVGAGN